MAGSEREKVSTFSIRPTTMPVRFKHLSRMLPTPFEGALQQIVRWRASWLGLKDPRTAMWVVYIPISDRNAGVRCPLRRVRASVPTITIERRIQARKLAVGMLVGLDRGRRAGGIAADVTRI